jgi:hypothetical protein
VLIALSLALAGPARADAEVEVSVADVPVPSGEQMTVEHRLGNLNMRGWDRENVRITARKQAPTRNEIERLKVNVDLKDGHIQIRTGARMGGEFRPLPMNAARIDLTIDAPRKMVVKATTWSGDLEADGFRAGADVKSMSGEVRIRDVRGPLKTHALRGKQRLESISGNVEADAVAGDVELDSIEGELLEASVVEGHIRTRRISSPTVKLFVGTGGLLWEGTLTRRGRYVFSIEQGDVRMVLPQTTLVLNGRVEKGKLQVHPQLTLRKVAMGSDLPLVDVAAHQGNITLDLE